MLGVLPAAVCVLDVRPAGALPGCGSAFDKAVLSTVALQLDWRATTPFIEKTNLLCVKPKTTLHARGGAAGRIRERVFFFQKRKTKLTVKFTVKNSRRVAITRRSL